MNAPLASAYFLTMFPRYYLYLVMVLEVSQAGDKRHGDKQRARRNFNTLPHASACFAQIRPSPTAVLYICWG